MHSIIKAILILILILNYGTTVLLSTSIDISLENTSDEHRSETDVIYISNCKQNLLGFLSKNENHTFRIINDLRRIIKGKFNRSSYIDLLEIQLNKSNSTYIQWIDFSIIKFTPSDIIFPFHYFW